MTSTDPETTEIADVLNRQRITSAYGALSDPSRGITDSALQLSEHDRDIIRSALKESPHPLAGFAKQLIDQWDHTDSDDRVAGLLLFNEVTSTLHRPRDRSTRRSPAPRLTR